MLFFLLGWLSWLVAWLRGEFQSRVEDTVIVKLPHCDLCSASGRPEPVSVNSEELLMTFVVHKDFKERVLNNRG